MDEVCARGFPQSARAPAEEFEQINRAWKVMLIQQDPSLKDVFDKHPAWQPVKGNAVPVSADE